MAFDRGIPQRKRNIRITERHIENESVIAVRLRINAAVTPVKLIAFVYVSTQHILGLFLVLGMAVK